VTDRAIDAKAKAMLEPFLAEAARAAAAREKTDADSADRARAEERRRALIANGSHIAFCKTLSWAPVDAADLRAEARAA
jgi:hypothetical protein